MKVAILGAGSMGTALALLMAKNNANVMVWSLDSKEIDMLREYHEQKEKLPGVLLPEKVKFTTDLEFALSGAEFILVAVPSQAVRSCMKNVKPYYRKGQIIASFSKGLEMGTAMRMTEIITEVIGEAGSGAGSEIEVVAMSGPCHAEELGKCMPSAYVAASRDGKSAEKVQAAMMSSYFRVYTSTDMTGVETGGAVKNIIALCAGIIDGIGYGDNTKAALMTRGMAEMTRFGVALGGRRETFAGLSGYGDLAVTCTSMHSRNRRCGILLGKGKTLEEAITETKMVVEGVYTTKAVKNISDKMGIEMPITNEAYKVIFERYNPVDAIETLMLRDMRPEI